MMRHTASVLTVLALAGCAARPSPQQSYSAKTVDVTVGKTPSPDTVQVWASFSAKSASVPRDFFAHARAEPVEPLLGRFFLQTDGESVVVLSNECWRGQFGARQDVIGQKIDVDGRSSIIVGVGPQGFSLPTETCLWTPKP